MAADDLDAATELNLRMWVDGPGRTAADVDPAVRAAVAEMQRRALELQAPHWEVLEEEMLVPDIGERLGAVHVPTLVLVGEEDVDDFQALATRMTDEIPDARLATIPGAAHVPNLERPLAFDAVVLEFLAELSVRARSQTYRVSAWEGGRKETRRSSRVRVGATFLKRVFRSLAQTSVTFPTPHP